VFYPRGQREMVTTKTQAVLLMYETLEKDGKLIKKDYLSQIEISDISFKRYVSELRAFFANFDPSSDIRYSRKNDYYFLVNGK